MLAILTTHPIQYQIPLWRAIAEEGSVPFEVWYLTDHGTRPSYDQQFNKTFAWDLDTLSGYPHRFLCVNPIPNVSSFHKLRLVESLRAQLRGRGVTALWIQGWQVAAYWQAVWQAYTLGIPVWLRGESNDLAPPSPLWKKFGKRLLLGQFFDRIQEFLYIGQANRRLYESFGVREEQLHPAPYCVDNERFAKQAESLRHHRAGIRKAWNIQEDAFCVLFAGKFIPKKRPFDLIAAAREQCLKEQPLHLLFVGSGELGDELRNACYVVFDADSTVSGNSGVISDRDKTHASFAGFLNQTEMSKAYVAADCLVLPSNHGETWGLVVNEAMASGLPCIASDACGCSEDLVAPINANFRFPLGDTNAMAGALLNLLMLRVPAAVWQEQVARFSVHVTVHTIRQLYNSIGN
jgi:glycosyltransferase involved in cell wall biosynthesis